MTPRTIRRILSWSSSHSRIDACPALESIRVLLGLERSSHDPFARMQHVYVEAVPGASCGAFRVRSLRWSVRRKATYSLRMVGLQLASARRLRPQVAALPEAALINSARRSEEHTS